MPDLASVKGKIQTALDEANAVVVVVPLPPSVITQQPLNLSAVVEFASYHGSSRYERFQRLLVLSGATASIPIQGMNFTTGGALQALGSASYTLLFDGQQVASVSVPAGNMKATFTVPLAGVSAGWHKMDIGNLAAGETAPTFYCYVKSGPITSPFIPVTRGTQEMEISASSVHQYTQAPGAYAPTPRPILGKRSYLTPPSLATSELHCEYLVPVRWSDIHRPNRNKDGIVSSFDAQPYNWSQLTAQYPGVPCLDGPRGVGTIAMATHVELGVAAPGGIPRNTEYVSDPWRVCRITEDGTITTLVGYRHAGIMRHWEDAYTGAVPASPNNAPGTLELVGDWSAIPSTRWGFRETWGFAWDPRTLGTDPNATPINGEQPHTVGPVMYVFDTQNNRVCRVQFSPVDRSVPAKVTELITGLNDPWEGVYWNGKLVFNNRKSHQILEYDVTVAGVATPSRTVLQGQALATIDINRDVIVSGTLAQRQAAPCVAPEGAALMDDWYYFGSKAQAQVKRVHLINGTVEVVCPVPLDGNSRFCKLAVCTDGTFGAKGTTFTWTWSNAQYGGPNIYSPTGAVIGGLWTGSGGTGDWTKYAGYGSAGAVGQGRLINAHMTEGLSRISKTQAGDFAESAAATAGKVEYVTTGLKLRHGENGFSFYGEPQPYGVTTNIDAFLTHRMQGT